MGGMNSIEGGRWDNLLRRYFTIKERGVAPSIAPEIVPTLEVESPEDPTFDFLRGTRLMSANQEIAAGGAATFAQIELRNPVGSGALVVMTEATGATIATDVFEVRVQLNGAGVNQITKGLRDLRWDDGTGGLIQRSTGLFLSATPAALLGVRIGAFRAVDDTGHYRHPIVLPPGYSSFLNIVTANRGMTAGFVWWERPAEPGELLGR